MIQNTLHNKISRLLVAAIVLTAMVVTTYVWNHTSTSIRTQLIDRLNLSHNVLEEQFNEIKISHLQNAISVAQNSKLIDAINTNNFGDIDSLLKDNQLQTWAEQIKVMYSDGVIAHIASTKPSNSYLGNETTVESIIEFQNQAKRAKENGNFFELKKNYRQLFLNIYLPHHNQRNTKIIVLSYKLDTGFFNDLKGQFFSDVSIVKGDPEQIITTTLPSHFFTSNELGATIIDESGTITWKLDAIFGEQKYFSKRYPSLLNTSDDSSYTFVSINSGSVKSSFLTMQIPLFIFSAIATILATFVGWYIAKQITKPLEEFSKYASKMAKGDYSETIELDSSFAEIKSMQEAFNSMLENVKKREELIIETSHTDPLTGLCTRGHIKSILESEYLQKKDFQAIGINIFGFRGINDVFGYDCGDRMLEHLAERVLEFKGTAARMTGGEILWIPEEPKSLMQLEVIKAALEKKIDYQQISVPIKLTLGFINCDDSIASAEELYKRLNIVIDEATAQKQFLMQYDDTVEQRYKRHFSIITNLKRALFEDADELALFYQPKVHLKTSKVMQAEALIRWNNAELGFVPPDEFIGIAERAGFIGLVTRWVLRRAVRDVILFKSKGMDLNIAVNISPEDILDDSFIPYVTNLLDNNFVDYKAISFEITESIIVEQPDEAIKRIQELRDAGFKLAIDDFGTGYSSLAYLTQLPVDMIKIDRSFVQKLAKNKQDQAICQTVIDLANKFNLEVVAEGIEDEPSMNLLRDWGCQWGQGYFINRPVNFKDFFNWLETYNQQADSTQER